MSETGFIGGGRGGVIDLPPDAQQPGPPPDPSDDLGLRCQLCSIDWPPIPSLFNMAAPVTDEANEAFAEAISEKRLKCPQCLSTVHAAINLNPIPDDEAWSLKNHADFARYYERTRGVHPDDAG